MKFNEHLLAMVLLVLLLPESTVRPSSGAESEVGMCGVFSILPSSMYGILAQPHICVQAATYSFGLFV